MRIGMNLLMWGQRRAQDLPGVLREAADAGYDTVELPPLGDRQVALEALEANGLKVGASHTGLENIEKALDGQLDWLERTGARFLACSAGDQLTGKAYDEAAARLNAAGARCREHGVTFCYHNHAHEIVHDLFGLERILRGTDPENVHLCVDTYWVARGGQDPVDIISRLGDRIGFMHLKDMAPDGDFAEVGQGRLDWEGIRKAVTAAGIPLAMVEQDRTKRTPLESASLSRRFLREHWA